MTCEYCGRQLLKGEKCSCSGAVKAREKGKHYTSTAPDIDLTESGYPGASSDSFAANDTYCNHNGTYFHQQTGWINANNTNSSNPNHSSYVYADYPHKKKPNSFVAVVIFIIIISFIVPVIAFVAFISSDSSSNNNYEWDYDYDDYHIYDYNDFHYDSEEGWTYKDDEFTSTSDYEYETGYIEDNVYTNYWANISFEIPKRYEIGTSDEYDEYASDTEDCAFLAFKDDGFGYIVITTSDTPLLKLYSTDDLINTLYDNIKQSFDESEMEYDITETYHRIIADENWLCFDVNLIDYGYMTVAFHRIDNDMIYIIAYDNSRNRTDSFLDSITITE